MTLLRRAALLALGLASFSVAEAGQINAQNSGLSSPDHLVDFGANLYANFTPITTEFPPLVFSHTRYFTTGSVNNMVGGFLTNDFSGAPDTFKVLFPQPIQDVSFAYHQIGSSQPTTFRVLLNGNLVDSFSNFWNQTQPNNYFGFTNLVFDELQVDFDGDFNIDTLAYNDISVSNTGNATCFGDNSGTACPCFAFGAVGAGCASSSTTGAVLSGNGNAIFSNDSFGLSVAGIPGAKAGLCVKGSTLLNGGLGNQAGDGLLCVSPQIRSQVIFSDAGGNATMADWQGQPFGTFPNAANAGSPTYYQWWYRDPANGCSGSGFNFSNAWDVTWMP